MAPDEHDLEQLLTQAESVGTALAPLAGATPGRVNRRLVAGLGELGLLPRLFGAQGISAVELCQMRRGLAHTCTEAETTLAVQGLGSFPVMQSARPEVAAKWIPEVAAGELVAAFALTEPDAGSDAAAVALAADRNGSSYRLSGEKRYISHAPDADLYTVFARTTPDAGARGVTAFLVPGDSPGLTGTPIDMLSPHPIGDLVFDGVEVPEAHVLGEVDAGFRVAMQTLDLFRPSVGAFAVGMAEAALRMAVTHARHRKAFGVPLAEFQGIAHQLADMATQTEAARLLVLQAAEAYDRGERVTALSGMAKLYATEAAQRVIDGAIQVHGARALEATHPLAHLYADVRATRIYEGTSEIQRNLIARELVSGRLPRLAPLDEAPA